MQVLFISSAIASGCLFLYLFVSGKIALFHSLTRTDFCQLIGLGFLGNFLYSAFYYASLRTLPSADACIINYLWPIIATICGTVVLHEKIKATQWIAILLSNLAYLTPVVAMVISCIALKESIRIYAIAGMLFVLSGCFLQLFKSRPD